MAVGDAGWTTAGDLPARWVIHTVGPNIHAGQNDPLQLASCYRRALQVADTLGAGSIAFPLIGAGAYGWPIEDATIIAIDTITRARTDVPMAAIVLKEARSHIKVSEMIDYHRRVHGPMSESDATEWLRLRHEWDPAPYTDSARLIVRDRTDGEPGVVMVLAETSFDYRTYHLGRDEIDDLMRALSRSKRAMPD
jgi:hypothetical protein